MAKMKKKYLVTGYVKVLSELCVAHTIETETEEAAIDSAVDAAIYEHGGTLIREDLEVKEIKEGE